MAGLVDKARQFWRGAPKTSQAPVEFKVRCACGETIQGYRRAEYQLVPCPQCEAMVFILPRSPLPEPPTAPSRRAASPGGPRPTSRATVTEAPPTSPPPKPIRRGPSLRQRLWNCLPPRSLFTTPRLVFAAVLVVVVGSTAWQLNQRHLRFLRENLVPEARRGLEALDSGDLPTAKKHLDFTVSALNRLRETVEEEAIYRQAHAELTIVHHLLDQPIDEILADSAADIVRINAQLKQKSIVLDVEVENDPLEGWIIHCHFLLDGHPIAIEARELTLWEKLPSKSRQRIIFGVVLVGVERQEDNYRLRVEPNSAVLLTHAPILDSLELTKDADTVNIGQRQRAWLGGNP